MSTTTHVHDDEIAITRGERLLSVVLAAFLLIGLVWAYVQLGPGDADVGPHPRPTVAEQRLLDARDRTAEAVTRAEQRAADRHGLVVDRREAYRTALDAGAPSAALEQRYRTAQHAYAQAQRAEERAQRAAADAAGAARPVDRRLDRAGSEYQQRLDDEEHRNEIRSGVARLLLTLLALGGSLYALVALKRGRSRWVVAGYGATEAATVLALVLAVDYVTDVIDPLDLGPLVLSLIGALLTLTAIAALQRNLAKRLPGRRVRRGECAFCGYPTRGQHCEGCGRRTIGECGTCKAPRRVGTAHCGACGAA